MMKRIKDIAFYSLFFIPLAVILFYNIYHKKNVDSNGVCVEGTVKDVRFYSDAGPSITYEYFVDGIRYEAFDGRSNESIGDKIVVKYKKGEPSESYVLSGCIVRYVKDKVTCECE